MFSASIRESRKLWMWRDYMAQNLWAVGSMQLSEYPWPSWIELTRDKDEPEQSGEDIYQTLLERWGGD